MTEHFTREEAAPKFEREDRYIVLKRKDVANLPAYLRSRLHDWLDSAAPDMPQRAYVVVENDWPEYETVFKMIEARVTGVAPEPITIELPDYNASAMGCGLEDRNITDRYEAMRYGWDCAMERVFAQIPDDPLYTHALPAQPAEPVNASNCVSEDEAMQMLQMLGDGPYNQGDVEDAMRALWVFLDNRLSRAQAAPAVGVPDAAFKLGRNAGLDEARKLDWVELMREGALVTWGDAGTLGYRVVEKLESLKDNTP